MEPIFSISTDDPDEVETLLTPIMGEFKISPFKTKYHAGIHGRKLGRLAIFSVQAAESRGSAEPSHEQVGLYVPLAGCVSVTENKRTTSFVDDIHLLWPDREFVHELNSGCRIVGANISVEPLRACAHKLTGSEVSWTPDIGNRIETFAAGGLMLAQSITRLWSELNRSGASRGSHIAITELEDELITNFVIAIEKTANNHRRRERIAVQRAMTRAEEYLDSNLSNAVSRADLAAAAGVSIRTLSRDFLKRYGTGPMGFLKARRLYAAYRQLLATEAGSITVTDVAVCYGFNHLGKFAVEYKQVFGESPSVSLNR